MTDGHEVFWTTVSRLFQHTRGNGQGIPGETPLPDLSSSFRECIDSDAPIATVRSQARLAAELGINATPTLKLSDTQTGKELILAGAIERDALLSALDLISADDE